MSADNYYYVTNGSTGYHAICLFASDYNTDEHIAAAHQEPGRFPTIDIAYKWASDQYAEYGVVLDPATGYRIGPT